MLLRIESSVTATIERITFYHCGYIEHMVPARRANVEQSVFFKWPHLQCMNCVRLRESEVKTKWGAFISPVVLM